MDRRDDDDLALASRCLAAPDELAATEERAVQVGLDDAVEVFGIGVRHGLALAEDTGTVDQDVGNAQARVDLSERRRDARFILHIYLLELGPPAGSFHPAAGLLRP